jgi:hypothetical protein
MVLWRVITAGMPGLTFQNAFEKKIAPLAKPIFFNRFISILGTTGIKTTTGP